MRTFYIANTDFDSDRMNTLSLHAVGSRDIPAIFNKCVDTIEDGGFYRCDILTTYLLFVTEGSFI